MVDGPMAPAGLSWKDNWPCDVPLPSEEELNVAKARMIEEIKSMYAKGYQGDWGFGLELTMSTYNRKTWWHLFFPTVESGAVDV